MKPHPDAQGRASRSGAKISTSAGLFTSPSFFLLVEPRWPITSPDPRMSHADARLLELTVDVVLAYVVRNTIAPVEVPELVRSVHAAFASLDQPSSASALPVWKPTRAEVRRSVSDAGIVSFIDGETYQSLKTVITRAGYTPDTYRDRFGLERDYPMVAPSFSAFRSRLAKAQGLGRLPSGPKAKAQAVVQNSREN